MRDLILAGVLLAAAACGEDAPPSLEERVRGVLSLPSSVDVLCPVVRDPSPGDLATCVVTEDDGSEVEVDLEFEDDGSITVVAEVDR